MRSFSSTLLLAVILFSPFSLYGMGDEHHDHAPAKVLAEKTFHAHGTIKSISENHESVSIYHDPITELKWPSMNMPFEVIDHELTHPLKVGDKVDFEFIQKEGKSVIIRMKKQ